MQRKRSVDLQACWRRTGLQTFRVLGCCLWTVIAVNLVAVFLEEGFHWFLPDDPQRYQLFYDLHILG